MDKLRLRIFDIELENGKFYDKEITYKTGMTIPEWENLSNDEKGKNFVECIKKATGSNPKKDEEDDGYEFDVEMKTNWNNAYISYANGTEKDMMITNEQEPELKVMQKIVGGNIESNFSQLDMGFFWDETASIKENKPPVNEYVSELMNQKILGDVICVPRTFAS